MSQKKHTPGPWKVIKPGHGQPSHYLCVQIGKNEAYTTLEMEPRDAILVAAAPDLYAACVQALATLTICRDDLAAGGDGGSGDDDICEEAKALTPAIQQLERAIKKAQYQRTATRLRHPNT